MATPTTLRPQEEVIDEFGVSVKYTILLVAIGISIVGFAVLIRFVRPALIESISSQLGLFGPLVMNGIILLIALGGLYLVGLGLFFRIAYHYFLTTERVIESVGFLSQHTVSAEYKHLTDLIVRQDPISHLLLNTGTLAINTAGGPKEEIILINIDNPTARREHVRGLAAAAQGGKRVTRALLHELKRQTGMADDESRSFTAEIGKITPAVLPDEILPEPITSPSASLTNNDVEDLRGDGIDDSDRLRAAQKKLGKK